MPAPHYVHKGSFFTQEQWDGQLKPHVDKLLANPGGIIVMTIDIDPNVRNYPELRLAVFCKEDRMALNRAITNARKRRAAKGED